MNWQGAGATTDDERRQYAQEFVAACRASGLTAVAISDHHDVAFFKFIKEAAEKETDELGRPLAAEDRLTVFPGMELTLAVPCQALLILDADFPVDFLPQVVQALSVTPAADGDAKHAPIQRLDHIKTLQDLYNELNKREFLRDRFIVLPHVGESGTSTLLRSGFGPQYKTMPCVGGFVDGSVTQHGQGNRDILNGKNKDYANKAIAVFQTSDNRQRDFADLGNHTTWVKWARPTAEALRQACLARFSRIATQSRGCPQSSSRGSRCRTAGFWDLSFWISIRSTTRHRRPWHGKVHAPRVYPLGPLRPAKETVQARIKQDRKYRKELLREGVESLLAGDLDTGKAILHDYINATIGFEELSRVTKRPTKSLMRMFGPAGNPQARNLFEVIGHLQRAEGLQFELSLKAAS